MKPELKSHRNVTLTLVMGDPLPSKEVIRTAFAFAARKWPVHIVNCKSCTTATEWKKGQAGLYLEVTARLFGAQCSVHDFSRLLQALKVIAIGKLDS